MKTYQLSDPNPVPFAEIPKLSFPLLFSTSNADHSCGVDTCSSRIPDTHANVSFLFFVIIIVPQICNVRSCTGTRGAELMPESPVTGNGIELVWLEFPLLPRDYDLVRLYFTFTSSTTSTSPSPTRCELGTQPQPRATHSLTLRLATPVHTIMIRRNILLRTLRLRSITTRTPASARRLSIQYAAPLRFQCSKRVIMVPRIQQNRFMASTVAATSRNPSESDAGGSELPTIALG